VSERSAGDDDRAVAADAIRLTRRIVLGTKAMEKYAPQEHSPGAQYRSAEALVAAAGAIGTTIFHPVGTCGMGREHDEAAVVDPQFRIRGMHGVRVVDASIMPTITSGNTNSPTVMIAERASRMIRQ
jgi:choline dehydrogenase